MARPQESLTHLYGEHIAILCRQVEQALQVSAAAGATFDGVVFHSGCETTYPADDQTVPFRPLPHFARWAPLDGPDHCVLIRPGETPRLFETRVDDYWTAPAARPAHPCFDVLECETLALADAAADHMGEVARLAFVGPEPRAAARLGLPLSPLPSASLVTALDWYRAEKTAYDVECLRRAAERAAGGHRAAVTGFRERQSEYAIHLAYLQACDALECETPYPNIIAWDERAAVLHYPHKSRTAPDPGNVLLIDAGATAWGYACDVTRTYAAEEAPAAFRAALAQMARLQRELVAAVRPGLSFVELHERAVAGVAAILADVGALRVSVDEALERGLVFAFLPHGLGHHLGLQVHDVGGQLVSAKGEYRPPPEAHPYLRTTRDLAVGQVVTIEPGLYFIETLLDRLRTGPDAAAFDWEQIARRWADRYRSLARGERPADAVPV